MSTRVLTCAAAALLLLAAAPSARAGECPQAGLENYFTKYVDVFGVHLFATAATPDDKVLHAAAVLAEYLDNDEDGQADDPAITAAMVAAKAGLVMFATEDEEENYDIGALGDIDMYLQGLYGEETVIGYPGQTSQFDASLEEVLHLITDAGWAGAYPADFDPAPGSTVAALVDAARGGHFEEDSEDDCEDDSPPGGVACALPPGGVYPAGAWYTYDDPTCSYACMITEYLYWAMTSILGGQDAPGRFNEIAGEWPLNTAALVAAGDPGIHSLLTAGSFALPTVLPDGDYSAATLAIEANPCGGAGATGCAAELSGNPKAIEKYVKKKWKGIRKCAKKAKPACPEACPVPAPSSFGIAAGCAATLDGHVEALAAGSLGSAWSVSGGAGCAVSAADSCESARAKASGKLLAKRLKRRRTAKMDKYVKDVAKCVRLADRRGACGGQALCDGTGLWLDQVYPASVKANGTGQVSFTAAEAGEAVAVIRLSSPDADWGVAGSESIVAAYSVDGELRGTTVLYGGALETGYRILLGHVEAGQHAVTLKHAKKLSRADRSPLVIHDFTVEVIGAGDARYDAMRFAPVLLGFDDDLNPGNGHPGNTRSDVPIIVHYDASPGAGKTTYSYTMIWSNEDGGTGYFPEVLMALWGRPHDIETIFQVEVADSGEVLSMRYRSDEAGTWPVFSGAFQGSHPVLRIYTQNGLIADDGDSKLRFAIYPFSYDGTGAHQRALMLDPVSYMVGAKELVREAKTESEARPWTTRPSDLRNYLWLELDIDVSVGGNVVRAYAVVDGETYLSDHGVPSGQVLPGADSTWLRVSDGERQTTVELPEGTGLDDISEYGLQGVGLMSGTMYYLDAFMLGDDYFPGEHRVFVGSQYSTGLNPTWPITP